MRETRDTRGDLADKVMTDEEVQSLSPAEFKRLTGVRRETFEHMVAGSASPVMIHYSDGES